MRRWLGVFALAALALLSGCSATRLIYNNADVFLRWQAGSYLDLHGEQREEADARIAAFLDWHRAHALPEYARLANEAAARLGRRLSREDLVWGYDSVRMQARIAARALAGEMAGLLDRLDAGQVAHFGERIAEDNRKFAKEHLAGSDAERRRRRYKRTVERLEDWVGSLSDAQEERVRQYSERAPLTGAMRDRERKRLQGELLEMVRAREARKRVADWAEHWDRQREPAFGAANRAQLAEFFDMLLDLDRTLSAEQRETAIARLREYAADFERLARR